MDLPRVFLSYPHGRNEELYAILHGALAELEEAQVLDWKDFPSGQPIGRNIFNSIREAVLVIAVLDDDHAEINHNVMVEFGYAYALDKALVPVVHRNLTGRVPFNLLDIKALEYGNLAREDEAAAFRETLTAEVRRHVSQLVPVPEPSPAPRPGTDPEPSVFVDLKLALRDAYARVRAVPGLAAEAPTLVAKLNAHMAARRYEEAQRLCEGIIDRLRRLDAVRSDWGFLMLRCLLGFVALSPLLLATLWAYAELGILAGELAGDIPRTFVGTLYGLGPLLLCVPFARTARARLGPVAGNLAVALLVALCSAWAVASYLLIGQGWPGSSVEELRGWFVLNAEFLARVLPLAALFPLAILFGMRSASLRGAAVLRQALVMAAGAAALFFAVRMGLGTYAPVLAVGTVVQVDAMTLVDELKRALPGTTILFEFVLVVVAAVQAPWFLAGRRRRVAG